MSIEPFRHIPEEASIHSPDYFLAHPPRQPKREIADYVANCGVLVPRRFNSLAEAFSAGCPFIIRNEHPQDYGGSSDLGLSLFVNNQRPLEHTGQRESNIGLDDLAKGNFDVKTREERWRQICAEAYYVPQHVLEGNITASAMGSIRKHCAYLGIPLEHFLAEMSYSYWEVIGGINRTVVADSAIAGRHHIHSKHGVSYSGYRGTNYYIFENGKVVDGGGFRLDQEPIEVYQSLIEFYESVRNLDQFDPKHSPILEVQTQGEDNYCLQVHRGRDFLPPDFVLEKPPTPDAFQALYVRGATPPEGWELDLNVHRAYSTPKWDDNEQAAYEDHFDRVFTEARVRQRKLQVVHLGSYGLRELYSSGKGHKSISRLHKSHVTIALSNKDGNDFTNAAKEQDGIKKVRVNVVSDGKKAYIAVVK